MEAFRFDVLSAVQPALLTTLAPKAGAAVQDSAPPAGATPPAGDGTTSTANSAGEGGAPQRAPTMGDTLMSFLPMVLIIAVFYFVMIGPERKQRKKREAMLAAIKKGDKVVTTGGMFARVAAVHEDTITLDVADGVRIPFTRQAIAQVVESDSADESKKA